MERAWFRADEPIGGMDDVGKELGHAVARAETNAAVACLRVPAADVDPTDLRRAVAEALESLRAAGFRPTVILISTEWDTQAALLGPRVVGVRYPIVGELSDVPVVASEAFNDPDIVVADLDRAIHWQETQLMKSGAPVSAEVRVFDEQEAQALAARQPGLFGAPDRSEDERVREIRLHAYVELWLATLVSLGDAAAIRRIRLVAGSNRD